MAKIVRRGSWFGHNPAVHMIENRTGMLRGYYNSNVVTTTMSQPQLGMRTANLKLCTGLVKFCKAFKSIACESNTI